MTKFPPSLSRLSTQPTERARKRVVQIAKVEAAIQRLPLKPDVPEVDIRKMSSLFEQTYYAVSRQTEKRAATTRTVQLELNALAKGLNKVVDHIQSMHPDTLRAWAAGADPVTNTAALLLLLIEAANWAQDNADVLKQAKRVGGRGRTEDRMAKAMRETAAFVYERLTTRKANIAFDAHANQERETEFVAFLDSIYAIYGVKASARSRARKRKSMAKKS